MTVYHDLLIIRNIEGDKCLCQSNKHYPLIMYQRHLADRSESMICLFTVNMDRFTDL